MPMPIYLTAPPDIAAEVPTFNPLSLSYTHTSILHLQHSSVVTIKFHAWNAHVAWIEFNAPPVRLSIRWPGVGRYYGTPVCMCTWENGGNGVPNLAAPTAMWNVCMHVRMYV